MNAGWGLGQSIVDGEVEADTYRVDRQTLALLEQRVGHKATRTGAGPEASRETVPEHQQQAPCLTAEQAAAVGQLALRAEAIIGRPVDVEWALRANAVWLLQARPITALPAMPAPTPPGETAQPAVGTPTAPVPTPAEVAASAQVGPSALFPFAWPDVHAATVHWQLSGADQPRTEVLRPLDQDVSAAFSRTFERAAVIGGRPRYQTAWYVNGYEYTAEVANPRPEADQALCREALEQTATALAERGESYNRTVWFPAIDAGNSRLAAVAVDALAPPDLAAHLEEALQWYERLWTWHWLWPQDGPARRFKQFYKQHFGEPATGQAASSEQALDAEAQELLTYEPNMLTQAIDGLLELAGTVQH
ncbi:MAG: PEP/pyruvate-binding domain-containing protein, partial [Chloroflexota bacterium]